MSETVAESYVAPGDADYVDAVWRLKKRIEAADGVLEQREQFFRFQYRRCAVHLCLHGDAPVGFAVVRSDGYLSLLGVDPGFRRRGLGKKLVERIARNHDRITCHTRTDNEEAIAFYTDLGFVTAARIEGYYRDGTDAYELELNFDAADLERILDIIDS